MFSLNAMSLNSDSKHGRGIFFAKLKKRARETHIITSAEKKETPAYVLW